MATTPTILMAITQITQMVTVPTMVPRSWLKKALFMRSTLVDMLQPLL